MNRMMNEPSSSSSGKRRLGYVLSVISRLYGDDKSSLMVRKWLNLAKQEAHFVKTDAFAFRHPY
jgi:hypothetical protein